ncbi:hypothetical protein [Shimia sp. R9_3]|uniref:hypothetical protein n=1 Tax=Shimia sp. R9_3 TaxID=2821113 RepID=UPI001AD9D4D5|nr:hypothetical protein [Shimia sp. R9_3]MBO9401500.1 hypothetical protein [Shimia sp. R9_3]
MSKCPSYPQDGQEGVIPVMCVVQAGQVPKSMETSLKARIGALTQRVFNAEAAIVWVVVPEGSGFTAALPSRTVITSMHANRVLESEERASLLKTLGAICMEEIGCSAEEVVTSVRDPE